VAPFYRDRFWLVIVCIGLISPLVYYIHIKSCPDSDNLWPVITFTIITATFVDSLVPSEQIVTGLIFTPVVNEFAFEGPFLKLGQNVGLLVGAVFWGVGSDIWGRRYLPNNLLYLLEFIYFFFPLQVVFQRNAPHYRHFFPVCWRFTKLDYIMHPYGGVEHRCGW
jgi:hypothetical protein